MESSSKIPCSIHHLSWSTYKYKARCPMISTLVKQLLHIRSSVVHRRRRRRSIFSSTSNMNTEVQLDARMLSNIHQVSEIIHEPLPFVVTGDRPDHDNSLESASLLLLGSEDVLEDTNDRGDTDTSRYEEEGSVTVVVEI
uniref:Uncharacterized protein n=1 Tax=Arcella intermedia TaxID=1963864 RepID=A0A6B2LL51_9EUKA